MRSASLAGRVAASLATTLASRAAVRISDSISSAVVAGRAVSAECDVDAGIAILCNRCDAARQLQIGSWAVGDADAGLGETGDFLVVQVHGVHGQQRRVDQPRVRQALIRALAVIA